MEYKLSHCVGETPELGECREKALELIEHHIKEFDQYNVSSFECDTGLYYTDNLIHYGDGYTVALIYNFEEEHWQINLENADQDISVVPPFDDVVEVASQLVNLVIVMQSIKMQYPTEF